MERRPSLLATPVRALASLVLTLLLTVVTRGAQAAPEAHILRIDPRAGVTNGAPVLTSVVEVVQFNRLSDALQPCANVTGYEATLDCWSTQIEKPGAIWSPFPFPEANARFLVKVNGEDTVTKFVSKEQWGASKSPDVGTAWLVALDASSAMGPRYADARVVAQEFIAAMGPNDLMDLMIFDDRARQYVRDSKWKTFKERNDLVKILNEVPSPMPSHGSDRPLFSQIKDMTTNAFGDLGSSKGPEQIPLHQAMVVLSNGSGRGDPASASPSAEVFHQYLNKGRFPEDNTSLPKTPLPVISIWFPNTGGIANSLFKNNDAQFMQSLANTEIGGYFDIVRGGQGTAKGKTIIGLVKQRFNAMWVVKWRLSCLNSSVEQSFNLVFVNTKPIIAPDGSFKDVPIGVDPSQWPLDIDVAKTKAEADANPLYPGGTFRVYGEFCWSGDKTRAEAYFVPAGTRADPNANSTDPELAKKAMQSLIAQNMRGAAVDVGDAFATFQVPDDEKVLEGSGDTAVSRVVLYDNKAHRASGHDEKSVLTLKAKKAPFNLLLILGIAGGIIVVGLLLVVLLRGGGGGGGGGKRRGATPPPAPVVAGGGPPYGGGGGAPPYGGGGAPPYGGGGGPPYGGGGAPGGGGYHASPQPSLEASHGHPPPPPAPLHQVPQSATPAMGGPSPMAFAPLAPPPQVAPYASAPAPFSPPAVAMSDVGAPPVIQVRCASCGMTTMATPGQSSVCFSCGQPIPANAAPVAGPNAAAHAAGGGGGGASAPTFPLTGEIASHLAPPANPPPNPYASATSATIVGPSGQYSIRAGAEVRVGRDPARCPVLLEEPRVSGVHSTLKFEAAQLWVRDETSNNGTYVDGARIAPATWIAVPGGARLRFGPIEFSIRLEP